MFEKKWSIFAYVTMTVIADSLAQCVAGGTTFAPVRFCGGEAAVLAVSPPDQKRSARLHSSFANTSLVPLAGYAGF